MGQSKPKPARWERLTGDSTNPWTLADDTSKHRNRSEIRLTRNRKTGHFPQEISCLLVLCLMKGTSFSMREISHVNSLRYWEGAIKETLSTLASDLEIIQYLPPPPPPPPSPSLFPIPLSVWQKNWCFKKFVTHFSFFHPITTQRISFQKISFPCLIIIYFFVLLSFLFHFSPSRIRM